jgi:hypothetical protein
MGRVSDVDRGRAESPAELGYVALAFDIHGGRYLDDPQEMPARCSPPPPGYAPSATPLSTCSAPHRESTPTRSPSSATEAAAPSPLELGRDGVPWRGIIALLTERLPVSPDSRPWRGSTQSVRTAGG